MPVLCPHCHAENRDTAEVCIICNAPLAFKEVRAPGASGSTPASNVDTSTRSETANRSVPPSSDSASGTTESWIHRASSPVAMPVPAPDPTPRPVAIDKTPETLIASPAKGSAIRMLGQAFGQLGRGLGILLQLPYRGLRATLLGLVRIPRGLLARIVRAPLYLFRRHKRDPHIGNVTFRGEFRNGRLQRFAEGRPLPPVPLELARKFRKLKNLCVNEGDEIEIQGVWKKKQYVKVKRLHNRTTNLEYR